MGIKKKLITIHDTFIINYNSLNNTIVFCQPWSEEWNLCNKNREAKVSAAKHQLFRFPQYCILSLYSYIVGF